METKRKFYIEHWSNGTWRRILGAVTTSLSDAEKLKLDLAKDLGTDHRNLTIVCEVKDWD